MDGEDSVIGAFPLVDVQELRARNRVYRTALQQFQHALEVAHEEPLVDA